MKVGETDYANWPNGPKDIEKVRRYSSGRNARLRSLVARLSCAAEIARAAMQAADEAHDYRATSQLKRAFDEATYNASQIQKVIEEERA